MEVEPGEDKKEETLDYEEESKEDATSAHAARPSSTLPAHVAGPSFPSLTPQDSPSRLDLWER